MSEKMIVGVDLGGTKIDAILSDSRGKIKARELAATRASEGPDAVIARIIAAIKKVSAGTNIAGVGIGAAGVFDIKTGVVTFSPNMPGWHNVPFRDIVQREVGIPTFVDNDATVAALGEYKFGAAKGIDHFVCVTLGTGIGGGIVTNGEIYRGVSGSAGEIGHMTIDINGPRCGCGNNGCWEAMASGTALEREAAARISAGAKTTIPQFVKEGSKKINATSIYRAAEGGDPLANELIAQLGFYLGVGLANLVNVFNPQLVVLSGGVSRMGEMLLEPARKTLRERAFEISAKAARVEVSPLGYDAGPLGAVALALNEMRSARQ